MRFVAALLVVVAAAVLQVTWIPRAAVAGVFPDLVLVVILAVSWSRSFATGLVLGLVAGVLLDVLRPAPAGLHPLVLCVALFAARLLQEMLQPAKFLFAACVLLASVAYSTTLSATALAVGLRVALPDGRLLLLTALVNVALAIVVRRPLELLAARQPATE